MGFRELVGESFLFGLLLLLFISSGFGNNYFVLCCLEFVHVKLGLVYRMEGVTKDLEDWM